ncbi:glycosyltransferase [Occultella kanbiaonis]|uniref:glycosyltransferase n=1 Tax=Occultella kanbiaonis TaxID=2675754 RepID=UPI0012B946A5|nr:glycosyltransferase [Occultella kanbiaonis]
MVSRIFSPEAAAASFRLAALANALHAAGARVDVLTVSEPTGAPPTTHPSIRISRRPVLRDGDGYVRGYLQYLSFDVPLAVRLLLTRRPDVVVVEPPPTTGAVVRLVCALRRLPYVYNGADVWSDAAASTGAPAPVVAVVRRLESFALAGAAAVLSVSDGVTERVRALGARSVVTTGNGVDTDTFTPAGPRHSEPDGAPYLLYAGTASEWQGADIFVRAMTRVREQVPGARLVFLGQGSAWPRLRELAAALPGGDAGEDAPVLFVPPASPAETATWLRGARSAVVSLRPGQGYDFAIPTKVFAALACGTPVVYTGPGPAGAILTDHRMGRVAEYAPGPVAAAMVAALTTDRDAAQERRLHEWVLENRSLDAAGRRGAAVVLAAAAP